jgi:Tfp pilus assembly protein PilO
MPHRPAQFSASLHAFYEKPMAKVSLELFLSIGLITLLGVFAIQPTLMTMSDLVKEIEQKKELDEKLGKKISALQSAQVVYTSIEPRLSLLEEAVPSKPQLVRTLKIVEKLASENNVVITGISTQSIPPEVSSDTLTPVRQNMPLTVSVRGDYPSIRNFVNTMLLSRRTFIVDTISFSVTENRTERSLNASLTVNAPYYGSGSQ